MNFLVWVMMGIAVWHFAVFVPDRFWGGIVGAFGAAAVGSVVVGVILAGGEIDDPSLLTALEAVPGALHRPGGLLVRRRAPRRSPRLTRPRSRNRR